MIGRAAGGALMALGAALGALPAFAWYAASAPGGRVSAAGLSAAGELWLLPLLGALAVLAGAGLVASPAGDLEAAARWTGPQARVAGGLALAGALRAGLSPRVTLRVDQPGGARELSAPIELEPAAVVTPIIAGAVAAIGIAVTWAGWRRAARP
ncbi:MAG TPA: hypothetical protein VK904_06660 [Miltoncostaeaceae bacterium]|nr:hypothetical protein [Miltoncostaeaceae bacterium]